MLHVIQTSSCAESTLSCVPQLPLDKILQPLFSWGFRGVKLTVFQAYSLLSLSIRDRFEGFQIFDGLKSLRCATAEHSVSL